MTLTIDDLFAPLGWAAFEAEYLGRKPLHLKGGADKFAALMSWDLLSGLLEQTSIWTAKTLGLWLDGKQLDPAQFCLATERTYREGARPDMTRVAEFMRRGASLVLNDIADLTPGLKQAAIALEASAGGKAQANLYCSWKEHPAFDTHFDTHDAYAFHIAGHKTWRVYQRGFVDPIAHPSFKGLTREQNDSRKGPVSMNVRLEPGDLLYLPRGWYHDALAESEGTIHVTFGITHLIGLALLDRLFDLAVADPLFRARVPDGGATGPHLAALGRAIGAMFTDGRFIADTQRAVATYRYSHEGIRLPDDVVRRRYRRRGAGYAIVERAGKFVMQAPNGKSGTLPAGLERPIGWIIAREDFDETALAAAFPLLGDAARQDMLRNLVAMRVIEPG